MCPCSAPSRSWFLSYCLVQNFCLVLLSADPVGDSEEFCQCLSVLGPCPWSQLLWLLLLALAPCWPSRWFYYDSGKPFSICGGPQRCPWLNPCNFEWIGWVTWQRQLHRCNKGLQILKYRVFLLYLRKKLFILYWGVVSWQCGDSFRWTLKGLSRIYTSIHSPPAPLPSWLPNNIGQSSLGYTVSLCWVSI